MKISGYLFILEKTSTIVEPFFSCFVSRTAFEHTFKTEIIDILKIVQVLNRIKRMYIPQMIKSQVQG